MTTRIYIKGDIGGPIQQIEVYDADTDRKLDDVAELLFAISANNPTPIVKLRRLNHGGFDDMELVKRKPAKAAGTSLYHFAIGQEYDSSRCETKLLASMTEREVQDDGRTKSIGQPMQVSEVISDVELYSYRGQTPEAHIERKAAAALGVILYELAEKIAKARVTMSSANTYPANCGPYAPRTPSGFFIRQAIDKARTGDPVDTGEARKDWTCPECKGTGFYYGLHSKEPCSKGCKP